MQFFFRVLATFISASLVVTTNAAAENSARVTLDLQSVVEMDCRVIVQTDDALEQEPTNFTALNAGNISGVAHEKCNSPRGYFISAYYRNLADDEDIIITYGDLKKRLDASGATFLTSIPSAGERRTPFAISAGKIEDSLTIHFILTAVGYQ